jgi:hypothetical protein
VKYTIEYDETSGICTVSVRVKLKRPEDSIILQQFARDFGNERSCQLFLFDMTQAEIIGGTMDIYKEGTVPGAQDYKQTSQKIALVYSGDLTDHGFMENVAVNRGYRLKVFGQIDKAIEWLKPI